MNVEEYNLQENIDCEYYVPSDFSPRKVQPDQTHLSFLHCNARSLPKNYENVNILLSSLLFKCSIIGISETWLHAKSPPLFALNGYKEIRKDRAHGRGGGVLMYISDTLSFKPRNDLSFPQKTAECLCVEIDLPKEKNFVVCIVYRPPSSDVNDFLDDLESLMLTVNSSDKSVCIMGDFNIDLLSNSPNSLRFQNILASNAFSVMIDKPTRISDHSSSLLDNIFIKTIMPDYHSQSFLC